MTNPAYQILDLVRYAVSLDTHATLETALQNGLTVFAAGIALAGTEGEKEAKRLVSEYKRNFRAGVREAGLTLRSTGEEFLDHLNR